MHRDEVIYGAPTYIRRLFGLRHRPQDGQAARQACRYWVQALRRARQTG